MKARIPSAREFFKYVGIHRRKLEALYGESAYSKLQIECGDEASKLEMVRTPTEDIMRQYGDLALVLGKLPLQAHWIQKGFKPTVEGLFRKPHFIKWSELPLKFLDWVEAENISGYSEVLRYIDSSQKKENVALVKKDREFEKLISDIRIWSPARRRNTEESYKIELRKHLESIDYLVMKSLGKAMSIY